MELQIIKLPLPPTIDGASAKDGNKITILINDQKPQDQQTLAFLHEMLHIWHNDHDTETSNVSRLELERHAELVRLLRLAQPTVKSSEG